MMAKGATWVVVPEQYAMFPVKLVEFVAAQPINFIFWVPTIMVNIANLDLLAKIKLDRLKKVFFIGEVFPTRHLNYWRRHLPEAMFVNLYGPIEITVACTYYIVDRELADDEKLPIGFPMRNTDILILNEQNQLAQGGRAGRNLRARQFAGAGLLQQCGADGEGICPEPAQPALSGTDLSDGRLWAVGTAAEKSCSLGRKDFQIKHLGYRIELGEIEHAVLQVDGVRNCCVVYNQNKKEIMLFYECDKELAPAFIRERLLVSLPKYMLPTVFNWMELMPRNPNGKIDRAKLVAAMLCEQHEA